jgi:NAD(P)-dependent dehydrogenase (short-subunit alcohol dehydrogenase family)
MPPHNIMKGQLAYAAGKGAVIGMTLPMARDLARYVTIFVLRTMYSAIQL